MGEECGWAGLEVMAVVFINGVVVVGSVGSGGVVSGGVVSVVKDVVVGVVVMPGLS